MARYSVFENRLEVYKANGRLIHKYNKEKNKIKSNKSNEHAAFDYGRRLKNDKWACDIPSKYKKEFGGVEEELEEEDFE